MQCRPILYHHKHSSTSLIKQIHYSRNTILSKIIASSAPRLLIFVQTIISYISLIAGACFHNVIVMINVCSIFHMARARIVILFIQLYHCIPGWWFCGLFLTLISLRLHLRLHWDWKSLLICVCGSCRCGLRICVCGSWILFALPSTGVNMSYTSLHLTPVLLVVSQLFPIRLWVPLTM